MPILHLFLKKGFRGSKDNYQPVIILLSKQIIIKTNNYIYGYNAQHCLLAMTEKWKKAVDNENVFGALLTDLSKAFGCLPHD